MGSSKNVDNYPLWLKKLLEHEEQTHYILQYGFCLLERIGRIFIVMQLKYFNVSLLSSVEACVEFVQVVAAGLKPGHDVSGSLVCF